jgi:hypothetical protein
MASENSYIALQRRIDNLTARTTPVAEPGRHIEKYLNMLKIMFGYLIDFAQHSEYDRARYEDYAEQTQSKITRLRTAFHMKNNKNTYLNNHRVSNNIANRVADQAQALYDDIVTYNESKFQSSSGSGSLLGSEYEENENPIKRARTESSRKRRGNRKSRKTRKTRKTRKMRR